MSSLSRQLTLLFFLSAAYVPGDATLTRQQRHHRHRKGRRLQTCGDGLCNIEFDEDCATCPIDCCPGVCLDGVTKCSSGNECHTCSGSETQKCLSDEECGGSSICQPIGYATCVILPSDLVSREDPSNPPSIGPSLSPSRSKATVSVYSAPRLPSDGPSDQSMSPSSMPSVSTVPSYEPSKSVVPSILPTMTAFPSYEPSIAPSISAVPSDEPSGSYTPSFASIAPSLLPSDRPSESILPTIQPSVSTSPSLRPSSLPSYHPSLSRSPTAQPSMSTSPSSRPTGLPSELPTDIPTSLPSHRPTDRPTNPPSDLPTKPPTDRPTNSPTDRPTERPSDRPTEQSTEKPTDRPSDRPSESSNEPSETVASSEEPRPLRVFVLTGQSNAQGHGSAEHLDAIVKAIPGTPSLYGLDDTSELLSHLYDSSTGNWTEHDDVYITYHSGPKVREFNYMVQGPLSVGYGVREERIGPELGFGWRMRDLLSDDNDDVEIYIIKVAWGGASLNADFRSPSSGINTERMEPLEGYGWAYETLVDHVRDTLDNITNIVPNYDPAVGYTLEGLVFFQGFNDVLQWSFIDEYQSNLENFVQDFRDDLNEPDLNVVIGELGMHGRLEPNCPTLVSGLCPVDPLCGCCDFPYFCDRVSTLRAIQRMVAENDDNVGFAETGKYNYGHIKDSSHPEYKQPWTTEHSSHYYMNADAHYFMGESMAEAMYDLMTNP